MGVAAEHLGQPVTGLAPPAAATVVVMVVMVRAVTLVVRVVMFMSFGTTPVVAGEWVVGGVAHREGHRFRGVGEVRPVYRIVACIVVKVCRWLLGCWS